jgi:hypothetical protein
MALTYIGTSRAVIDSPGDYTIDRDLTQPSPTDAAIYVNPGVHYVTIRLRSRITGTGGSASTNCGVEANNSAMVNIIGDGGNISGFCYGGRLLNCYLARVRGVFVRNAWFRGIRVDGDDATVEGCDVRDVTGALWTPNAYCMGIEVQGLDPLGNGRPKVLRNSVCNVAGMGSGESVGISISDKGKGGVVKDNTIANPSLLSGSFGLWVGGNSDVAVAHNIIDTWGYGVTFSSPPTGRVDENFFRNCATNILDSSGDVEIGTSDLTD